jgi:hypothetical protein
MSTYFGKDIYDNDTLMVKVTNLSTKIENKKNQFQNMKNKIEKLTELNRKLTNGYELSLKVVVDVSKLLQNYTRMFDDLDEIFGKLDDEMGIQQVDIKYISELTKESIKKITLDFNEQYPVIVNALEKNGNKESLSSATKLKAIINELPLNAAEIEKDFIKTGGGRKVGVNTRQKKSR